MRKKKKKSVVFQIVVPLFILLLVLIAGALYTTNIFFVKETIAERADASTQIANYAASYVSDFKASGWLRDYWLENYEEMNYIYDEDEADMLEEAIRDNWAEYNDPVRVTSEEISAADKEIQKMFAELCYARMSAEFDRLQQSYHCTYICSFVISGDECIYFLSGCDHGESHISEGGYIYELGEKTPFSRGVFPVLDNILDKKADLNDVNYIIYETDAETDVDAFSPAFDDSGDIAMVISVDDNIDDILKKAFHNALIMILIILFLLIILFTMENHLLFKNVVRPIRKEEKILAGYIEGKDSEKVVSELSGIRSNNEIETLAENFSYMATEIDRYINEVRTVTAEKERISAELNVAAGIQASQLPRVFPPFPDRTEFDIFASMYPAKEVGGDFYDFFFIDDDHITLVIADVSGKGVPAALFMMSSKMLIKSYSLFNGTPAEILGAVNDRICENNADNMFVTVWLGILEISTGKLTCCNAGHEDPVIRRADGKFELLKDKHGLFVGVMPEKYNEYEIKLEKGDIVFVYTDGLPEATNSELKMFRTERMVEALNSAPDGTLSELLQTVKSRVDEFVGEAPQFDDLTMLAIKYFGK